MEAFQRGQLLLQEVWNMNCTLMNMKHQIDILSSRINIPDAGTEMGQLSPHQLKQDFFNLTLEINDIEQYAFATDVEIHHVEERDDEDSEYVVLFIAARLGVMLELRDIVRADRVGTHRGGMPARPLIVRFTRRAIRNKILEAAQVNPEERSFKIYERLTALNQDLFYRVLKVAQAKHFKYVWCKEGKIYTKRDNGCTKIRIHHTDDLNAVFDLYQNLG